MPVIRESRIVSGTCDICQLDIEGNEWYFTISLPTIIGGEEHVICDNHFAFSTDNSQALNLLTEIVGWLSGYATVELHKNS